MDGELRTIAVIPARAGSKGLPGKNLKLLAGKPLLAYSIEQARASDVCDVVLVSTEDDEIARVAREYGAEVPFRRPSELAGDSVPAEPVVKHALETYEAMTGERFDIVIYLQPTDVFRTPRLIRECVERLKANPELDSVFVAYKTHKNFWRWTPQGYARLAPDLATYRARQERRGPDQVLYREDAGLVSASRSVVVRRGMRLGQRVDIVATDDFCTSIDIHDAFDLWLAEKVLREWKGDGTMDGSSWLGQDVTSWAQKIRNGYARAFILFALHETGVFETLRTKGPLSAEELARLCGLQSRFLEGVLNFLVHADLVLRKYEGKFSLTERGQWLFEDQVLALSFGAVGAYACLLYELVPMLRGQKTYGVDFERRGDLLAKGSYYTGKGNYGWIVGELSRLGVRTVADLGCGSCEVLIAFCRLDPQLRGVGIDISPDALKEARNRIHASGLSDRIELTQGDLTQPDTYMHKVDGVQAFHALMALHEFLRDGEEAVVEILRRMKRCFPNRHFIVGEFNAMSDEEFQATPYPQRLHPLFYQHILHTLTPQGMPITKERWLAMFERAGLKVLGVKDNFPFRLVEYVLQF